MNKTEKIIFIVAVILALGAIIYFGFIRKDSYVLYYRTKSASSLNGNVIQDFKTFKKAVTNAGVNDELVNAVDFSKSKLFETFNEEFFENNNVVVVSTYEDTSHSYIFGIDGLKENSDGTATVTYTDYRGEYVGPFGNSWYNTMFVVLNKDITNVSLVKAENK